MKNFKWNKIPFEKYCKHFHKTRKKIKQIFQILARKYSVLNSSHHSIFEDGLYNVGKRKDVDSAMKQILCVDCAILV
jgi:hypothetical protein